MHHSYSIEDVIQKLNCHIDKSFWAKTSVAITTALSNDLESCGRLKYTEPRILVKSSKFQDLFKLAILSYELPVEVRYYLQRGIEQKIPNNPEYSLISIILKSKTFRDLVLLDYCRSKTAPQVFGNFLDKNNWNEKWIQKVLKIQVPRIQHNQPTIPSKRRIGVGYRDKGSLPKTSCPGQDCFRDHNLQMKIEEHRKKMSDLELLLEGMLI